MTSLNLIQQYSSDSDGENDNCQKSNSVFNTNSKNKIPLPPEIVSMKGYAYEEEIIDNPDNHEGRIRSFKHERGNWATFIYCDYILSTELITWMKKELVEPYFGNMKLFDEFHISLSKTFILKFHWIDSFTDGLKKTIRDFKNFTLELSNLKVYCNEDKTRTFLGVELKSTNNSLGFLAQAIDKLLSEFELPKFYKDPSYHISFCWCTGDNKKILENYLPNLTARFSEFLVKHPEFLYIKIQEIKLKTGNKLYNYKLR